MKTPAEYLRSIVDNLTRKTLFYGFYPYRVLEQVADKVTVQAVSIVPGLDDQRFIVKAHGFAGVTETLSPGSIVLLGFEGGDPARPFIAHYLSGTPTLTTIDAGAVHVGGDTPFPPVPVALANKIAQWVNAVEVWADLVDDVVTPLMPAPQAAAYAAAIASRIALSTTVTLPAPMGMVSTKLSSQ